MRTTLSTIGIGILAQLLATSVTAQELPPHIGSNPVVLSVEEALQQGAPPSIADNVLKVSRIDLSLDQDEFGQWGFNEAGDWHFSGTGGDVQLELFPGEVLWIRGTGVEDAENASSWIGEVLLPEPGTAIITRSEDGVYGTFDVGTQRYALVSGTQQGRQAFAKLIDSRDIGTCLVGGAHGDPEHHKHFRHPLQTPAWFDESLMQKSAGGSTSIDILFLYTPGALSYMGPASAFINNLVASMNVAFSSSSVNGSVRAVYYGVQNGVPLLNTETQFNGEITKMHSGSYPYTGLAALRNAHSADIVVLFAQRTMPSDICGAAGGFEPVPLRAIELGHSGSKGQKAYAIVSTNCADDSRTFHHEVGHLLGGWHDEEFRGWDTTPLESGCGIGNMSCGYTDVVNRFRTVMGSWPPPEVAPPDYTCTTESCPRLLRFSDLNQTIWANGGWRPLGKPKGSRTGYEDFVATMNGEGEYQATIPWVASYRTPSGSPPSAPTLHVDVCHSLHSISWSGTSGTIGWYEVQTGHNASFTPAATIYRGPAANVFHSSSSPIRIRARACNAVGCSAWSAFGPSNPSACP